MPHYLLGTDEAGYGPNLGPLVIGASAWRATVGTKPEQLYELLSAAISAEPTPPPRLQIADSKAMYAAGLPLIALELPALALLRVLGKQPHSWREIWGAFGALDGPAGVEEVLRDEPWHAQYDEPLPCGAHAGSVAAAAEHFASIAGETALVDLQAAAVFPQPFNAACELAGNKATVLSITTLQLIRRVLGKLEPGPATIVCDKHGGRDRYAGLLQQELADGLVKTVRESRHESSYQLIVQGRSIQIRFITQGEQLAPPALASIIAKYLRELAMRAFNRFWQTHLPGLKSTAGYPADAKRYFGEIRQKMSELGIAQSQLWRNR